MLSWPAHGLFWSVDVELVCRSQDLISFIQEKIQDRADPYHEIFIQAFCSEERVFTKKFFMRCMEELDIVKSICC